MPPAAPPQALAPALAVIGAGAMSHAILSGALRSGALKGSSILAADPDESRRNTMQSMGLRVFEDAASMLQHASSSTHVMLAVKPQIFPSIASSLRHALPAGVTVLSILAGVRSAAIARALTPAGAGTPRVKVIRVMPNTPCSVGKGVAGVALGAGATEGDDAFALRVFGSIGDAVPLREDELDAFTAIAGSGPAYLFYLAEAIARGGAALGIAPATAERLARGAVCGAAALLEASPHDTPAQLRAAVTSKGGATLAATDALDAHGVMDAFVPAFQANHARCIELGVAIEASLSGARP